MEKPTELEFKHLVPYSQHRVSIFLPTQNRIIKCVGVYRGFASFTVLDEQLQDYMYDIFHFKPILKPLNDLHKDKVLRKELFDVLIRIGLVITIKKWDNIGETISNADAIKSMPFEFVNKLISNHYDIWYLIDAGLAVDINTL